jgi:L,D-transpeptidase ErfK/SrfK
MSYPRSDSIVAVVCVFAIGITHAQTFDLRVDSPDLVGELALATTVYDDTLSDLARAYDQGYLEMRLANPGVDPWIPGEGTELVVPSQYVLPQAPRKGIVINVPEMRLYYFPRRARAAPGVVITHPISIGRQEWLTPHGATKIVARVKDPAWYPPKSIREEHAANGDPLPTVVPAGPENPLGAFALRLGIPGYLIHGTNRPYGIGMRVTHGCVRMYPKDIKAVFSSVSIGTPVHIVNQPYKIGVAHGKLYLEVHPHLSEDQDAFRDKFSHVMSLIVARTKDLEVDLSWKDLQSAIARRDGIPVAIGTIAEAPAGQTRLGNL